MKTAGLLLFMLFIPTSLYAAELININTADAALLDTLPGIGPTYAQRIIDYRTAHGPFAAISDIQNVSGIGPSTYANMAPLITVGDASAQAAPAEATSTPSTPVSGGAATYVPPPAAISISVSGSENAFLDVPLRLSARVTTKSGAVDQAAQISWSFGDGSFTTGSAAEKTYRYAGTYLVIVKAADGSAQAQDELIVTVRPVNVRLAAVSGEGITIVNDAPERLDLSGWRLISDMGSFRVPEGTALLPYASVLFPSAITNLPFSLTPQLAYPDGIIAARYEPAIVAEMQLPSSDASSYVVQTVSSPGENVPAAGAIRISGTAHEDTSGRAPAAANELAAAGAALPEDAASPASSGAAAGLLHSPWTLGLLGVIALAGGAFILL